MTTKHILTILFAALLFTGCGDGTGTSPDAFASVEVGDNYAAVIEQLGEPTKTLVEFDLPTGSSKAVMWETGDGGTINVFFKDGRVVSRTRSGG
jgi:PBP1b-binding outer membrane lipoprotein LpoB